MLPADQPEFGEQVRIDGQVDVRANVDARDEELISAAISMAHASMLENNGGPFGALIVGWRDHWSGDEPRDSRWILQRTQRWWRFATLAVRLVTSV